MFARTVLWAGVLVMLLAPHAVRAADHGTPLPTSTPAGPRDGGVIGGRVASIDFERNVVAVDVPGHGRVNVWVMPSTSIQGRDAGFYTVTDIRRGGTVEIYTSQVDGKYTAQIIKLK
jgi:hypothetical protein